MKHFLLKAFNHACNHIEPIISHTNLWLARMMTDRDFLSIRSSSVTSKSLRKIMGYYNAGESLGRDNLFRFLRSKTLTGDLTPRPIMKLAGAMAFEAATILPRVAMAYPSATALTVTAVAAAALVVTQGNGVTDLVATWMGSRPGSKWRVAGESSPAAMQTADQILSRETTRSFPRENGHRADTGGGRTSGYNSLNAFGLG